MKQDWDLIIIGGGITGAGIFNQAAQTGLKVLILEKDDFSSGTSSRSSKLVHGGLRYLKQGKFGLTMDSVRERERLLSEARGLVTPLQFALPIYDHSKPGRITMESGLTLYDLMAQKRSHAYLKRQDFLSRVPKLEQNGLQGGFIFSDAQVDDARLVLRLIFETERRFSDNCQALNYHEVTDIIRDESGHVTGVISKNKETGEKLNNTCKALINATGAWADRLHPLKLKSRKGQDPLRIRPLRGSHLVFPFWRLPVAQAVSFFHPQDGRPVFLIPWEGVTLFGTTDLDHPSMNIPPVISDGEMVYLLEAVNKFFPGSHIRSNDILSTFSGIRPVISSGKKPPSQESRESEIWQEKGLLSVTGGKLTTFRKLAEQVLLACSSQCEFSISQPLKHIPVSENSVFEKISDTTLNNLPGLLRTKLTGRYGNAAHEILKELKYFPSINLPGTSYFLSELAYIARHEKIRHLDDLLLRRTRIGLVTANGGKDHMPEIEKICTEILGWDSAHWNNEANRYANIWTKEYAPIPSVSKDDI